MDRRRFLLGSLGLSATAALAPVDQVLRSAAAATPPAANRTIATLFLPGGPDLRFLFPPAFDPSPTSYGYAYWQAQAGVHGLAADPAAWERRWEEDYLHVEAGGARFGILRSCGWLKRMWEPDASGRRRVALVHNVVGATSRNHRHAQLVWQTGHRGLGLTAPAGSGWGGRLAALTDTRIASATPMPLPLCQTIEDGTVSTARVVTVSTPENTGLYTPAPDVAVKSQKAVISRALSQYYAAKREEIPAGSPYRRFVEYERLLRELGAPLKERLIDVGEPEALKSLYSGPNPRLASRGLGEQVRNLYYAFAASDLIGFHLASLALGGFDTHDNQKAELEPRLADLFGDGKALDTFYQVTPPDARAGLVFVIGGEFGRQLRGNGHGGTDHGRGATLILIGEPVQGGLYGDPFPSAELARLGDPSPDIEGRTDLEAVFGVLCDWIQPGLGPQIFEGFATAAVESGVALTNLLR